MSPFVIHKAPFYGLQIIQRQPLRDERGYLERVFCEEELKSVIGQRCIVQINHTFTAKLGTVRGMHFQYPPHAEMKIVSCLRGKVFDVAVDLRKDSPTFLQWHAEVLSESNFRTIVIPEGFAHGFQTLSEDCELLYLHTAPYVSQAEVGLNALDTKLAIDWPLPVLKRSERDQQHAMLSPEFSGLVI
jgi:dTDP-4-dehydrorhamnose 3,5-epimerase